MTDAHSPLIDSHAHLDFPDFEGCLDEVISRALDAGVTGILTIGTTYAAAIQAIEITGRYDCVFAAAGIHPNYVAEEFGRFEELAALFETKRLLAVGETGLDFYRDHTPRNMQLDAFKAHINLALERDLPLVIHIRQAFDEALAVLDSCGGMPTGVFHCFSGTASFAREVLKRGFYISIAGQVTFKKATDLRNTVAGLPLDRLLVETDCPYLAPVPNRGKPNEPAFVHHTAAKVAECMGLAFHDVANATTTNASRLFRMPPRGALS